MRKMTIALSAALVLMALLALIAFVRMSNNSHVLSTNEVVAAPTAIAFAVLGDSDSHAYQDGVLIPLDSGKRGGKYRATTFQWTEVLARLRGNQIHQGEWGTWGTPIKVADVLDWSGFGGRAPRKRDFRYNFAVSGAECKDLMTGYYRQASRLVTEMNREPAKWKAGVVVIQIGINTIGQHQSLERYAKSGMNAQIRDEILACVDAHRQAISLILTSHPQTRFVLAGIFDNSNIASNFERWAKPVELANIAAALDVFDEGVRALCAANRNMTFIDARRWFRDHWGARDVTGKPAYKGVNLGGATSVMNTIGDDPRNAILADEHGGVVFNALWANRIIEAMNSAFGMNVNPITPAEIALLVDPTGSLGLK
jgi:hypothetical protein